MNGIHAIREPIALEVLERQLRAEGFAPGVPRHIDVRTRAIDAHACRSMRCPSCNRRKMVYRPFTNGSEYVVLAVCQNCLSAEEV